LQERYYSLTINLALVPVLALGVVACLSGGSEDSSEGLNTAATPNGPPVISGSPRASVVENNRYSFVPTANDPDGDPLTFSVDGLPGWANFDSSDGSVTGTSSAADVGEYRGISVSVSDGKARDSIGDFSIEVLAAGSAIGSVSLSWQAPTENEDGTALTDLAGFKIYWGTTPGRYPNSVTIDNPSVTAYVVENLAPGEYEFVGTSFNAAGVESRYSSPVSRSVDL
jgi:hypothetical protein